MTHYEILFHSEYLSTIGTKYCFKKYPSLKELRDRIDNGRIESILNRLEDGNWPKEMDIPKNVVSTRILDRKLSVTIRPFTFIDEGSNGKERNQKGLQKRNNSGTS